VQETPAKDFLQLISKKQQITEWLKSSLIKVVYPHRE
jgi:hypothetical protein